MTRQFGRRLVWVGIATCVVALAFGVTNLLLGPAPGVTEANVKRLRLGMTKPEVKAILGQLPAYPTPPLTRGGFGASGFTPGGGLNFASGPNTSFRSQRVGEPRIARDTATKKEPAREEQAEKREIEFRVLVTSGDDQEAIDEAIRILTSTIQGEGGTALILFGADDRLIRAEWWPNPGATVSTPGLGERLRSWLGW